MTRPQRDAVDAALIYATTALLDAINVDEPNDALYRFARRIFDGLRPHASRGARATADQLLARAGVELVEPGRPAPRPPELDR